ncbi:MAG: ECF-type sigma factor [Pseudomonadota bacterium]
MAANPQEITRLIADAKGGDRTAEASLYNAVYGELRRIASAQRRRWSGNNTLSTTVLVNEAYLKLASAANSDYGNRLHFFATAARAMRQVLVNYAERMQAQKRAGGHVQLTFSDALVGVADTAESLLTLHRLLSEIEAKNPRYGRLVECRLFGGLSVSETATAIGVSDRTVKRDWALVTAWLVREMEGSQ